MANKIKVIGKTQNGVALGVIKSYVTIYPNTTLDDLRRVFSNKLAPDNGVKEMFLPLEDAKALNQKSNTNLYFVKDERVINLSNGNQIAFAQIWTAKSLPNLIEVAANMGIEVEIDKETDKDMKKVGYALEYLNGWQPAAPKKGCLGMATLLLITGSGMLWGLVELIK